MAGRTVNPLEEGEQRLIDLGGGASLQLMR